MDHLLFYHHYGQRYLSVRDFMDFCCFVGIHVTEEAELEFYEECRLLFPAARIVKPDDYLRSTAGSGDMPDQYVALHHLLIQLHFPISIKKEPGQSLAHPIDEAFGRLPELLDPRQTQFHPWDSHVEVFYHYWQVYELYQIRRDKGLYADVAHAVRGEDEWQFAPPTHMVESKLLWNRPVAEGDYLGLHDDFDALSRFIYLYNQERNRTFALVKPNEDLIKSLAPGDYEQYESRVMNIAKDISQQCELDEKRLYAFMQKLMEMHYSYQQAEKSKLADSIKTDIGFLMRMIEWITGQDSMHIAEKAGNFGLPFRGPNYLETIFPNARAKARDKAAKILTQWAERYNLYLYPPQEDVVDDLSKPHSGSLSSLRGPQTCYEIPVTTPFVMNDTNLDALIMYIDKTDLAIFEYALFTLNETWWGIPNSTQSAAMYFCIKNLAALPEAFLRRLYDKRKSSGASLGQPKGYTLLSYAKVLIKNESALSQLYNILQEDKHLSKAKTPEEFERNFEDLRDKMDSSVGNDQRCLAYCHLMAALVRNFTHHHPVAENSSLFDNRYLRAIQAILSVVFFAWVYACRQRWID